MDQMRTTNLGEEIYVLCAFEMKSVSDIKTPAPLLARVERRLRAARLLSVSEERR